jgi:hypothetical protein
MRRVLGLSVIVPLLRLGLQVLAGADVRGASEVWQQRMSKQDTNYQQEKGFRHQAQEKKEMGNRGVQLTLLALAPNRLQSW